MIPGITISASPEIHAFGQSVGRKFSAQDIETINASINSVASIDGDGRVSFAVDGQPCDLGEVVAMMSAGIGRTVEPGTTTAPVVPVGATRTAQAVATNRAMQAGREAELLAQAQTMADTHGNPWNDRYVNRTRQAFITKNHPVLAARLKLQAGVRG